MKKIAIFYLVLLLTCMVRADIVTVEIENDFVASTDRYYTHGTRVQWLSDTNEMWGTLLDEFTVFDDREKYIGINISQYIYTPSSKKETEWLYDDRPYCGWLYLGLMGFAQSDKHLDFFELDAGVIGDYSYAEETQTFVHEIIKNQLPMGWDNQIENQIGADFIYQHKYRKNIDIGYFDLQIIPHGGGCIGNIHDYLDAGVLFRLGHSIPNDFGFIRMQPASRLAGLNKLGYYVFADTEGKYVIKNLTIDGRTKWGKNHIEEEPFVGELSLGIGIRYNRFDVFYSYNIITKEFDKQEYDDIFGSFGISYIF